MQSDLRDWLIEAGFPVALMVREMQPGLGSTELWACSPAPDAPELVVRIYAEHATSAATRESLALRAAARHGLPAPKVIAQGSIGNRPVLAISFIPGVTMEEALMANPESAHDLGIAMGQYLGKLHRIQAPDGLDDHTERWLDRGGPALEPIRPQLAALPHANRLLHLDYHPRNIMVNDGRISGIIDWENTTSGPPFADLARTRAILRMAAIGGLMPNDLIERFELSICEGHAQVIGPDPQPLLSAAWGLAMTVQDLKRQARKPGSPIPPALIDLLAQERDGQIRAALATSST